MSVYIEYVILDNLIINYIILSTTFACIGETVSKKRKLLSATIGTIFVILMPFISQANFILLCYRLVLGVIMIVVASKLISFSRFLYTYFIFIFITFLFGGLLISMLSIFDIVYTNSGLIFLSIELPVSIFILPIWVYSLSIVKVIKFIKMRVKYNKFIFKSILVINDERFELKGFLDTGNSLYDEDGRPCIVIELRTFLRLFPNVPMNVLMNTTNNKFNYLRNMHYITVDTVNAKEELLVFDAEKLIITLDKGKEEFDNICVAVSRKNFSEYNLILHRNFC